MKKLFFVLAAVSTMVSCSKDQVVDRLPEVPIAFSNVFVDNSTKAIDNTYTKSNLTSFNVYGTVKGNFTDAKVVNIFNNIPVTKTGVDNTWNYDNKYTQYWVDNCIYEFAAVVYTDSDANASNNNSVTVNTDGMPTSISYNVGNQVDLLYAKAERSLVDTDQNSNPDKTSAVEFSFSHLLSKVHFTFENTITTNVEANQTTGTAAIKYSYKVTNIKITNAVITGTYTIADDNSSSWGTTNWTADNITELVFDNASNATNSDNNSNGDAIDICSIGNSKASATSHHSRVLIPTNYDSKNKLNITFTAELYLNGKKIQTKNHSISAEVEFNPGCAYNLIIGLGNPGNPITFTVSDVQTWGPTGGVTTPEDNDITPASGN